MAHSVVTLNPNHDVKGFTCGTSALDIWLQTIASQHQKKVLSSTFVLTEDASPKTILGFYALAIRGMTPTEKLPSAIAKRLPLEVPGITLGRLAVAEREQGKGHGSFLLIDAMSRARRVALETGGFALFVDAKDEQGASFYRRYGFVPFPSDPLTLCIRITSIDF